MYGCIKSLFIRGKCRPEGYTLADACRGWPNGVREGCSLHADAQVSERDPIGQLGDPMPQQLTPEQKSKIARQKERRRRERERREDEYRRRIEELRRRIAEARNRRQRLLLMLLLALLAALESTRPKFAASVYWPDPTPDPTRWTPDPSNDYAPAPGNDDHCDGYSYEQWNRMLDERGIRFSRKSELRAAWEADPERVLFPDRYKNWGYKPFLAEIMNDLSEPRYQPDALKGLKLLSPPETHQYLDEVYAVNPLDLLHCRAALSADIVRNFQSRAVLSEEHKKREAEEAKRDKELSGKNDDKQGIPKPK